METQTKGREIALKIRSYLVGRGDPVHFKHIDPIAKLIDKELAATGPDTEEKAPKSSGLRSTPITDAFEEWYEDHGRVTASMASTLGIKAAVERGYFAGHKQAEKASHLNETVFTPNCNPGAPRSEREDDFVNLAADAIFFATGLQAVSNLSSLFGPLTNLPHEEVVAILEYRQSQLEDLQNALIRLLSISAPPKPPIREIP